MTLQAPLFKNDKSTMAAEPITSTDADGNGPIGVKKDDTRYDLYFHRKSSNFTVDNDLIVTGTIGQWVKFAPVQVGNNPPSGASPTAPVIYIQKNTNTGVPLTYYNESGSSSDWKLLCDPPTVSTDHDPDQTPDGPGQKWINVTTGEAFIAVWTDSSAGWVSMVVAASS